MDGARRKARGGLSAKPFAMRLSPRRPAKDFSGKSRGKSRCRRAILPYSCGAAGGSCAAAFLRSMQEASAFLISHSVWGTSSMMRSTGA